MPVTPRCIPPSEEKGRPAADAMRNLGENEIRCEGKNAGGRVLSSDSSPLGDVRGPPVALGVNKSLREKSAPCQGSAGGAGGRADGGRAEVETARGRVGSRPRGGGGNSAGITGQEVEGAMRLLGAAAARGGGASGGGRQNEPAEEDGVMAHEVASLHGDVGNEGYGESEPEEEGEGGHSARSSRSAHGSSARGRASAAAASSAMSNGFLAPRPGRDGLAGGAPLALLDAVVLAVASREKCIAFR